MAQVKFLFLDIGGVMLNNGWDRNGRKAAIEKFGLEASELDERHHLTFDTYEEGKISLDEYLDRTVFFKERDFTKEQFKQFMFELSQPLPEMIELFKSVKEKNHLKIAVVNNEGRELNDYRISHFGLENFIDFFISSCFVHIRKPDADIFSLALDIAHAKPEEVVYIDDRAMFVQVAGKLGLKGIVHKEIEETKKSLLGFGLDV
ncbi:HAD family hydrolase [Rhizosphaericola mali]|uniref:HAD family phosphatase n=1 Tax=Rhizosphaericola mali TaxID=2545455 RepID=A0A5P2G0C8_9BACT|nr:HAD family phosphatase [Rhizosphaericola mali]QES89254.1 HAD family phosphatase [Rhizosphaericola mali]